MIALEEGGQRVMPSGQVDGVPAITGNTPGSLAWRVLHERHPRLIRQVAEAHPYPSRVHRALDRLFDEITEDVIRPLDTKAADKAAWDTWVEAYLGQRWSDAPFLWAETYFYRRLLEAVEFFTPGVWYRMDPFEFLKTAELHEPNLDAVLASFSEAEPLPPAERIAALLTASSWGNRADLGMRIGLAAAGEQTSGVLAGLLVDDRAAAYRALADCPGGTVVFVADNAGAELLADLVLVDHLIEAGLAGEVVLHIKPQPHCVSDAVTADVVGCLHRLAATAGTPQRVAGRLRRAVADGRVRLVTHWFYCAPLPFHRMPPDLADEFAATSLVIMKGDLNYRRLAGDCAWPPTTPFASVTTYFPAPVLAMRTIKSDLVIGVSAETVAALDAIDPFWRGAGTRGMIQFRP